MINNKKSKKQNTKKIRRSRREKNSFMNKQKYLLQSSFEALNKEEG
jgi:hypothetical protein